MKNKAVVSLTRAETPSDIDYELFISNSNTGHDGRYLYNVSLIRVLGKEKPSFLLRSSSKGSGWDNIAVTDSQDYARNHMYTKAKERAMELSLAMLREPIVGEVRFVDKTEPGLAEIVMTNQQT